MRRGFLGGALFSFALLWQVDAQQVEVPRQTIDTAAFPAHEDEEEIIPDETAKAPAARRESIKPKITLEDMRKAGALAREKIERETRLTTKYLSGPVKTATSSSQSISSAPPVSTGSRSFVRAPQDRQSSSPAASLAKPISLSTESAFTKLADGFDFPIGKPDSHGYYKARGYRSNGHLGEDWDGVRGGDTDLGDPIYAIGDGVVVFARDCHMGWGNVVIIRHTYREHGDVKNIDSLYGHLQTIVVRRGQSVTRGQKIATMGNAHGIYDAHLHLEVRKNLAIGMSRAKFARDSSNYYDPSQFILSHRHLQTEGPDVR